MTPYITFEAAERCIKERFKCLNWRIKVCAVVAILSKERIECNAESNKHHGAEDHEEQNIIEHVANHGYQRASQSKRL